MMSEDNLHYDVICVGAGFAGLTATRALLKERTDLKVCVLEANGKFEQVTRKYTDATLVFIILQEQNYPSF